MPAGKEKIEILSGTKKNAILLLLSSVCLFIFAATPAFALKADVAALCFSPGGGCTNVVVKEIGRARRDIRVAAYDFTSWPIARALAGAKKRGVDVRIVFDSQNAGSLYSMVNFLRKSGIPVYADVRVQLMHDKVMVMDGRTVITGSFNWTRAAELYNAENLLVIRSRKLAGLYLENWHYLAGQSVRLAGPFQ